MKQVRFYHVDEAGSYNYEGRVYLKDGKIRYESLPESVKLQLRNGLVRWKRPRKIFTPKDGLAFLKLIPATFRGSYFRALPIEEVNP